MKIVLSEWKDRCLPSVDFSSSLSGHMNTTLSTSFLPEKREQVMDPTYFICDSQFEDTYSLQGYHTTLFVDKLKLFAFPSISSIRNAHSGSFRISSTGIRHLKHEVPVGTAGFPNPATCFTAEEWIPSAPIIRSAVMIVPLARVTEPCIVSWYLISLGVFSKNLG